MGTLIFCMRIEYLAENKCDEVPFYVDALMAETMSCVTQTNNMKCITLF